MEPIDGAAVDESGEAPESIAECVTDWTHCETDVQVHSHSIDKVVVHRQWRRIYLLALKRKIQKILHTINNIYTSCIIKNN